MRLRDIDFGSVLDASGVRGFFGEGYAHHRLLTPFGLRFDGSTFVAKTATFRHRAGNMPLGPDLRPAALKPACVRTRFFKGAVLNAVGLTNPGLAALLADGRWQERTEPFLLSFAAVGASTEARLSELRLFAEALSMTLPSFKAPIGLQLNISCPNSGHAQAALDERWQMLDIAAAIGVPLMPKASIVMPVDQAVALSRHPACDALCVSNTVPWGAFPEDIDWRGLFGSEISPLAHLGGGGLSGKPIARLVPEWLRAARLRGLVCPVNAGGGVLGPADAARLRDAGADSVFLGSIAILRPWRVQRTIRAARALFAH